MQVKVRADSLLAVLPNAHRGKHIDRQADEGGEMRAETEIKNEGGRWLMGGWVGRGGKLYS